LKAETQVTSNYYQSINIVRSKLSLKATEKLVQVNPNVNGADEVATVAQIIQKYQIKDSRL